MAEIPPICEFGWKAADFTLEGTDGQRHSLQSLRGEKGTLIVFMCNHCPYVKAILDRLIRDTRDLAALGVSTVGINDLGQLCIEWRSARLVNSCATVNDDGEGAITFTDDNGRIISFGEVETGNPDNI